MYTFTSSEVNAPVVSLAQPAISDRVATVDPWAVTAKMGHWRNGVAVVDTAAAAGAAVGVFCLVFLVCVCPAGTVRAYIQTRTDGRTHPRWPAAAASGRLRPPPSPLCRAGAAPSSSPCCPRRARRWLVVFVLFWGSLMVCVSRAGRWRQCRSNTEPHTPPTHLQSRLGTAPTCPPLGPLGPRRGSGWGGPVYMCIYVW